MRWVKIFSHQNINVLEKEVNDWISSERVLVVNASISEDDDGFRVLVVYERAGSPEAGAGTLG